MCSLLLSVLATAAATEAAPISFARSFGDSMVLQAAPKQANVWGFVSVGLGDVTVTVSPSGALTAATTSPFNSTHATWRAALPATPSTPVRKEGGVYTAPAGKTVTASAGTTASASIRDVQFGEVWVCSGQSNMAFLVQNAFGGAAEVQKANNYPAIRMMTTKKVTSAAALQELSPPEQRWSISSNLSISQDSGSGGAANDDNWLYMSAMCYFYGQRIFEGLGGSVPVGLVNTSEYSTLLAAAAAAAALARLPRTYISRTGVRNPRSPCRSAVQDLTRAASKPRALPWSACGLNSSDTLPPPAAAPRPRRASLLRADWGGTDIESWSSPDALAKCPGGKKDGSVRYNAMIAPLLNMTIRGAIWYQGEANSGAPELYGCQLPAMIDDWRAKWHEGTGGLTDGAFPFGFVQLAGWVEGGQTSLNIALTRWYMTAAQNNVPNARMPNVFMGTAFDLGDSKSPYGSVHPRYKQEAAARLAAAGLAVAYGQAGSYWKGPVPSSATLTSVAGDDGGTAVSVAFTGCGAEGIVADQVNTSAVVAGQPNWSGQHHFEVCISADATKCDPGSFDAAVWVEAAASVEAGAANGADACSVSLRYNATVPAAAVRYAWRAFPCEKMGCSVYSKKEQIPPAPFLLNITASSP